MMRPFIRVLSPYEAQRAESDERTKRYTVYDGDDDTRRWIIEKI